MFEYLEDTRETSHGVRGSRSGMPADIMARMEDGVIEPKSVLQIFVVSAQESPVARAIIERVWNLCITCRLLRMTLRGRRNMRITSCFCSPVNSSRHGHMKVV